MTVIPFGTRDEHAVIIYDRVTRICAVIANSLVPLPDAVATARTLNADHVHIVAPLGAEKYVAQLRVSTRSVLYEFAR